MPTQKRGKRGSNGFGNLIRDYDRDGVPNIIDCAPRNRRKHGKIIKKVKGFLHRPKVRIAGWAGAGALGTGAALITGTPQMALPYSVAMGMTGGWVGGALGGAAGLMGEYPLSIRRKRKKRKKK